MAEGLASRECGTADARLVDDGDGDRTATPGPRCRLGGNVAARPEANVDLVALNRTTGIGGLKEVIALIAGEKAAPSQRIRTRLRSPQALITART